ncbi:unnamed protein product [Aphanomyces euteiches]
MGNAEFISIGSLNFEAADTGLEELERLREGFRRVTSVNRNAQRQHGMDKETFRGMVLSAFPRLPKTLGERIFDVLNTEHSGLLQWSELLSALDLTQSTNTYIKTNFEESQCKLLFAIYDLNDTGQLQRDILERFVTVIFGVRGLPDADSLLNSTFASSTQTLPTLGYKDFAAMFQAKEPAFLFTWIRKIALNVGRKPNQAIQELQNRYNVVYIREKIRSRTHLTMEEICGLEKWFQRVLSGRLKLETTVFVSDVLIPHVSTGVCELMTIYLGDKIDFTQFCTILSKVARGTSDSKRSFLFEIAQVNGRLTSLNATRLGLTDSYTEVTGPGFDNITEEHFLAMELPSMNQLSEQLTVAMCSHFDFCLKPKDPCIEKIIVESRWLEYEKPNQSHVWFLLDTAWWYKWCGYCDFHPLNGTKGGLLPFPTLPLDIVQLSGLHHALPIESTARPGPIRNWSLQYRHGSRRLKLDMVVGQHFHLIPEPVYITLTQCQDSVLIVEIQESDGSWPLSQKDDENVQDAETSLKSYSYGLVGLDNLGNTCYMSSAIQCLSHSRLLCDYFRSGHYRYDLNLTNKLGTQGKLAVAFGNLLSSLWSTNKKNLSPLQFRNALAKFNRQFDNYDQHDSQELLAFLLSGLSEDLNRVKEMPAPVEQPDSDGRCDTVVADEWWQNYLKREVSIIVALFMGQYKSLLSCNTCHHQSASFEPFTFLQLPLHESETRLIVVTVLSQIKDEEQIIVYQLEEDTIEGPPTETKLQVGDAVGVQNDRSPVPSHARITACNDNGTYDIAFWTGKKDFGYSRTRLIQYAGQQVYVNLVHRRMENATVYFTDPHVLRLFGTPLVVPIIPQRTTGYRLYSYVWHRLRRIFHWSQLPDPVQIHHTDLLPSDVSTVALGTHLEYTRFGFCLRLVTMDGMACSRCPWYSGCRGCLISSHPDYLLQVCGRETIAIDWDIQTMAEDYDSTEASKVEVHDSFQQYQTKVEAVLSIDSCLKDFTASELIDEAYCSRCKSLTPSTKKMDLWRLPPLLIIQLKRFQYTTTSRRKLRNFVHFPLKGLDLQDYLVQTSTKSGLQYWQFLGGRVAKNKYAVYDLYAVVNHIGALGGGHYVANVFSESDKKWKCFNDHLCRDIDEKDVVSPSAYILFYIRRDMKSLPIQEVFPVNGSSPVSDEDIAALLQESDASRCVIS